MMCVKVQNCVCISVSKYEFTLKLIDISNLNEHLEYISDQTFAITLQNIYLEELKMNTIARRHIYIGSKYYWNILLFSKNAFDNNK